MTNAFEKQSQQGGPLWAQPVVPAAVEGRAVLHVVSTRDYAGAGTVTNDLSVVITGTPNPPIGGHFKRIMDLAVAGAALVLAAPIMILVAVLIKMTAGGPAVFAHRRIGFGGSSFNCYKFRSMVANSDQVLEAYLESNPHARKEWEETHKIRNDPRVTLFGRLLRKSSLDELPQLINILRGDMSCVGPRPIVED